MIELPSIKIFHYCGGLNFASRTHFRNEVYRLVEVNPQQVLLERERLAREPSSEETPVQEKFQGGIANMSFVDDQNTPMPATRQPEPMELRYLIVDFSALSYIDPSGVKALQLLGEEFHKIDVALYIAGISGPVYETLKKCDLLDVTPCPVKIFPTVHDAVICAQNKILLQGSK